VDLNSIKLVIKTNSDNCSFVDIRGCQYGSPFLISHQIDIKNMMLRMVSLILMKEQQLL
jgi:hypothetical protein